MTNGLWLTPNKYLDFAEAVDRSRLTEEIASRQAAWDWTGMMGLLPDPDPILRKLGDGAEILESLTADGHLCSVIQTRKLGTLKKEFQFEPGSLKGEKPSAAATKLRDQLVEDLERVDLYHLVSGILDAPLYGMTPVELKWAPGQGRVRIKDLEVKPARWFGFDEQNAPRFVSQNNLWEGEELPFGKFVIARHFPTYDNPYGLRLLWRCFWPSVFKKGGIKFWVTLAEKYGMPFLVGKYRTGAPLSEQQEMLGRLAAMVRDAVAVIPQGGTVEVLESKGSGKADIHSGLKEAMDAEMSKVIMGQTLTAEVGDTGSYAASKTHDEVLEDFRDGDQKLVKTAMEEIAWLYGQVNAPGVPTPNFTWHEEDDPKKETAERDKTLKETGVKFKKGYYVRTYNLQEDDFELEGASEGGRREPEKPEFGECPHCRSSFAEGVTPDTADRLADRLGKASLAASEAMIEPLKKLVNEAKSLEQILDGLLDLYGEMTPAALGELVSEALTLADAAGRFEVTNGN